MLLYFVRLIRRFRQENFPQLAGSLAFTTLLSLVPFVAIALTVASMFPVFALIVGYVDNFLIDNLMPGKTGGVIAKYMTGMSAKANKLSLIGLIALLATSLILLSSIEKAFNHLWRVKKTRPLHQRIGLFAFLIIGGPLVAGAVIATMTYAVTVSLGFFNEPLWVRQMLFKLLAMATMCCFLAFLYAAVPNARVRISHAFIGGFVATIGIAGAQKLFEIYVVKFSGYKVLYGTFAIFPIFLLWIYLCWVVVLIGALIVANFRVSLRSTIGNSQSKKLQHRLIAR